MANFNISYNRTADHEGGFQSNPNDTGNYNSLGELVGTNWGISAPVYEDWIGSPPSLAQMQQMSQATAKEIYRVKFWDDIRGDEIQNQKVADIFFDGRVNHGRTGTRIMQRVLGVWQDTIVGPVTLDAINSNDPATVYYNYREERRAFYYELSARPGQSVFLNGWLNRLNTYTDYNAPGIPIDGGGILAGGGLGGFLLLSVFGGFIWTNRKEIFG